MEGRGGDQQEIHHDHCHEDSRKKREPIELMFAHEIDGAYPQGDSRHGLCAPSDILPHGAEAGGIANLPSQQGDADGKDGKAEQETGAGTGLMQAEGLGDDQTGGAEAGATRGDGRCHNTQQGEDAAGDAEP